MPNDLGSIGNAETGGDGDSSVTLLIGTKKGFFTMESDASRSTWTLSDPHFLGHLAYHAVLDPRDGRTLLLAAKTGHLGPTVFRSTDFGRTWSEAKSPPAFPKVVESETGDKSMDKDKSMVGRAVHHVFWIQPSSAAEPDVWYAGVSPPGLFRSEDAGETWAPVAGWNDHPMWAEWTADGDDGTPDGSILHSINVDPRDPAHLYIGNSGGGIFESVDAGASWSPFNNDVESNFNPTPYSEYGQDPHCVRQHPLDPDVIWQQNHCGIYRVKRPSEKWIRVGDNMPTEIGDIGFPIELHPRDPKTAWVFPMDGTDVWPRTSPAGRPAVYRTRDAGESWQRCDAGLPAEKAWMTVLRQAMTVDHEESIGVYFGTTTGQLWASADEGEAWTRIADNLPHIYSVEIAGPRR